MGAPSTEAGPVDSCSFQASPSRVHWACVSSSSPTKPGDLVPSRGTRNSRSRRASLLVPPCQLPVALDSPAWFPSQLRLQGRTLAPVPEPSSQHSRQQSQCRVSFRTLCWSPGIHTPVLSLTLYGLAEGTVFSRGLLGYNRVFLMICFIIRSLSV